MLVQARRRPMQCHAHDIDAHPAGARITLGDHEFADELRGLDIGATLMSSSISHLSMTFGDAEVIGSAGH